MKKIIRSFILSYVLLTVLLGCSTKSERPFVFIDESGKEYKGIYKQPDLPKPVVDNSGHLTVFYSNEQKWIEGNYARGKPHGVLRMWRKDGSVFSEEHYKHGLSDGKVIWWHPNGKKNMEIDWVNGKKNGLWVEWDKDGVEIKREKFKDDQLIE